MSKKLRRSHTAMCQLCGRRVAKRFIYHIGDPFKTAHYADYFTDHYNKDTGEKCPNSGKCVKEQTIKEGE